MNEPDDSCLNCKARLPDAARFCPQCSQPVQTWIRPWRDVVRELLTEWFDVDGRMVRSFRALLFRPGLLTREYLDGRRLDWSSPVRMYLLVSLLFFLVLPAILPQSEYADMGHKVQVDYYSRSMFALLPVFALLLKLFYGKHFYTAHLVFSMHGFSAMFISFGFMLSIESLADTSGIALAVQVLLFGYMLIYALIALHRVYAEPWPRTALKLAGLFTIFLPMIAATLELASHL